MMAASEMLAAARAWAAPTRGLCPEYPLLRPAASQAAGDLRRRQVEQRAGRRLRAQRGDELERGHRGRRDPEDLAFAALVGLAVLDGEAAGAVGRAAHVGPGQRGRFGTAQHRVPHDRAERNVDEAAVAGVVCAFEAADARPAGGGADGVGFAEHDVGAGAAGRYQVLMCVRIENVHER